MADFLVISQEKEFINQVTSHLAGHTVSHSNSLSESLELHKKKAFALIYLDDSFSMEDCREFLKGFKASLREGEALFLGSSDFKGHFKDGLDEAGFTKVRAVFLPTSPEKLAQNFLKHMESVGLNAGKKNKYNVDTAFMKIFIESAKEVLGQWLKDQDIKIQAPMLLKGGIDVAIRGRIRIKSPFFEGSFFVSFPESTYKKIYQTVTGEAIKAISAETADFAGEIVNIIYGNAKKVLNEKGYNLAMAFPTWNQAPSIDSPHDVIVIPIETNAGKVYLKIAPNL